MNAHLQATGSVYSLTPETQTPERHTLSVLVDNEPGILARIVGLFSARGFNIETISVGESLDPRWSRVTIVTRGMNWRLPCAICTSASGFTATFAPSGSSSAAASGSGLPSASATSIVTLAAEAPAHAAAAASRPAAARTATTERKRDAISRYRHRSGPD